MTPWGIWFRLWQALGIEGLGFDGARCPVIHVPAAARRPASKRNRAASGQAEAKWIRMRAAISTTRAPTLSSRSLRVVNSALASGLAADVVG